MRYFWISKYIIYLFNNKIIMTTFDWFFFFLQFRDLPLSIQVIMFSVQTYKINLVFFISYFSPILYLNLLKINLNIYMICIKNFSKT